MNYQLPEYEPSDNIWNNIEAKLNDDILQKAIQQMPEYEPQPMVWESIEAQLYQKKTVKLFSFKSMSIAASVLLILGIGLYVFKNRENVAIQYSEQAMNSDLLIQSSDDSSADYEMITAFCREQNYVCENPEFKNLKTELDELQTASVELKEAMGQYNTDADLMAQLADIEHQKSEILKKMADQI
jgi:hypothetical protein